MTKPTDDTQRPLTGSPEEQVSQPFDDTAFTSQPWAAASTETSLTGLPAQPSTHIPPSPFDALDELSLVGHYPIRDLLDDLDSFHAPPVIHLTGVHDGLKPALIADLQARTKLRVLVLSPNGKTSNRIAQDLKLFAVDHSHPILYFPPEDTSPYGDISSDRQNTLDRLASVFSLQFDLGSPFLVLPIESLMRRILPADILIENADMLRPGTGNVTNERLRSMFTAGGYTSVSLVEDPGTYAIRGDIVDLWTPFDDLPVRIERWGDEVTECKTFDPRTQRTLQPIEETFIFPVREEIFTPATIAHAKKSLIALAEEHELDHRVVRQHIRDLEAGLHFLGIESVLPAFYPSLENILDLVSDETTLVILDDPEGCWAQAHEFWEKRNDEYTRRLPHKDRFAFPPERHYIPPNDLKAALTARKRPTLTLQRVRVLDTTTSVLDEKTFEFRSRTTLDIRKLRAEYNTVEQTLTAFRDDLLPQWRDLYGTLFIPCDTAGQSQRLSTLLDDLSIPYKTTEDPLDLQAPHAPPLSPLVLTVGSYSEGARIPARGIAILPAKDIFGHKGRKKTRSKHTQTFQEASSLGSFKELKAGDFVVHSDFGIAKYGGLIRMSAGGIPGDFLQLLYNGNNKLYLPVYRLERIQRYTGSEGKPRLDKLGSSAWERTKERIKATLKDLAFDLIALYAKRQTQKGHAFDPPTSFFRQFEDAFPFEPTPDQEKAIDSVLDDLQSQRITDRLICGDVGFGKTEVAIRAAFLAVLDGKQVTVLVPTTVLAEQHLATFRKRLENFPVRVESLSRFRTRKQTTAILKDAEHGKVDILIGTHRLLSKDVKFRELGLLIIDEEQRFGVTHKEKLKSLKAQIDCITLSATPIPRTLQMSLLGIRDMSIIATPPPGRLAVRTHIARFSDNVIREAILRELERGGQVYFVHNRVQTINELAAHIRDLVPEARLAVGHGQMKESELEKVMLGFVRGESNVLLSTTIIESGLDISNANTMIIDRAENFGLSQLYQLRGRIGRSKKRAYCYLLVRTPRLTDIAQQRLDVIERFTDLGSGFHVASYDLEIRGAGNILGPEQSGSVAAVGLDLYTELLEEAITEVRGEEVQKIPEPEVNIPVPAFIPEGYILDTSLRLLFYKRLSLARSEDELEDLITELNDRFGALPDEVAALKEIVSVKIALRSVACARLDVGTGVVVVHLGEQPKITPDQAIALIHTHRGRYSLSPDMKLTRRLSPMEAGKPLRAARMVCRELLDAAGVSQDAE